MIQLQLPAASQMRAAISSTPWPEGIDFLLSSTETSPLPVPFLARGRNTFLLGGVQVVSFRPP